MTVVPCKSLCLATLLAARAVADDAFLAGYKSCDDVLKPGGMEEESSGFVPLKWKEEILDEYIVPVSYRTFSDTWDRIHIVSGARKKFRPYSLRVGTAGRLDGSLERALCNFILSQSTDVFEHSYQPVQVAAKLPEIAYGESAKQDEALWSAVSNALIQRDGKAPIHITQEDLSQLETRQDMQELRRQATGGTVVYCPPADPVGY
ncbi:hypothetical protein GMORB2_3580 [Geosmithia morbida]|uniref:Uncharacterized protein n=1 Tax=Geosmithia morbida TaxID=1094350 RepID=A0A9P4YNW6_9HYPO|nr:uncharacterized protein GMORB2_3580 [Geosmithia morbida]KAF4119892.1 hypothetical protein GMORB2_3580 [Geosmithia morbida]